MTNIKKATALLTLGVLGTLTAQPALAATGNVTNTDTTTAQEDTRNVTSYDDDKYDDDEGYDDDKYDDDEDDNDDKYDEDEDEDDEKRNKYKKEYKNKVKKVKTMRTTINYERKEKKNSIKYNREEMKTNLKDYRKENKSELKEAYKSLDENIRDEMKALKQSFFDNVKNLKKEYKNKDKTEENIEAFRTELNDLEVIFYAEMKELAGNNELALNILEKRKNVYLKNKELRKENVKARVEFRGKRDEIVSKYKKAFIKRLENKLDNISEDKLEKISGKIDSMIEKFETKKMNEEKKDKILSQLLALKEIIDEKLDGTNEVEDINIFEILEVE